MNFELPAPTDEEFKSLVESIRKHGIQDPIIRTVSGLLIAGENRLRAAKELQLSDDAIPEKIIADPEDPDELRIALNVVGRQVSTETKKTLARRQLQKDPSLSSRAIAALVGLDKNTVQALKNELVAAGEIHQVTQIRGKEGKIYNKKPAKSEVTKEAPRSSAATHLAHGEQSEQPEPPNPNLSEEVTSGTAAHDDDSARQRDRKMYDFEANLIRIEVALNDAVTAMDGDVGPLPEPERLVPHFAKCSALLEELRSKLLNCHSEPVAMQ